MPRLIGIIKFTVPNKGYGFIKLLSEGVPMNAWAEQHSDDHYFKYKPDEEQYHQGQFVNFQSKIQKDGKLVAYDICLFFVGTVDRFNIDRGFGFLKNHYLHPFFLHISNFTNESPPDSKRLILFRAKVDERREPVRASAVGAFYWTQKTQEEINISDSEVAEELFYLVSKNLWRNETRDFQLKEEIHLLVITSQITGEIGNHEKELRKFLGWFATWQEVFPETAQMPKVRGVVDKECSKYLAGKPIDTFDAWNFAKELQKVLSLFFPELYQPRDLTAHIGPSLQYLLWLKDEQPDPPALDLNALQGVLSQHQELKLKKEEILRLLNQVSQPQQQIMLIGMLDENLAIHRIAINHFFSKNLYSLPALVLDIEFNGLYIKEIAWQWQGTIFEFDGDGWQSEEPSNLLRSHIAEASVVVGHNIFDFDKVVLEKNGVAIPTEKIWDTIYIEALLCPDANSYALKTAHHAKEDVGTTLQLLHNQIGRLLTIQDNCKVRAFDFLPTSIQHTVGELKIFEPYLLSKSALFQEESLRFFPIPKENLSELQGGISQDKCIILFASRMVWASFEDYPNIRFLSERDDDRVVEVASDKIQSLPSGSFGKGVLEGFIEKCAEKKVTPALYRLAFWIRLKIDELARIESLCVNKTGDYLEQPLPGMVYILDPSDTGLINKLIQNSDFNFYQLQPELAAVFQKEKIGFLSSFDLAGRLINEKLWPIFSGGSNVLPITREQLDKLNFKGLDASQDQQFWLKAEIGGYAVWCETNGLKPLSKRLKTWMQNWDVPNGQANGVLRIAFFDEKELADRTGILRFNPETPFRDHYWTAVARLALGVLGGQNMPNSLPVLLVEKPTEVLQVEQMLRDSGCYIPAAEASLRRRFDLLAASNASRKIIVLEESKFDNVLALGLDSPLLLILESLPLRETLLRLSFQTAIVPKETLAVDPENGDIPDTENESEENSEREEDADEFNEAPEIDPPKQKIATLQEAIEFLSPWVLWQRNLLLKQNPDSRLILLDSRLSDYSSLTKTWQADRQKIPVWPKKDDYKIDLALSQRYFPPSEGLHSVLEEAIADIEKCQEAIEHIFLGGQKLRPDQQVYLPHILPARDDVAVSLPTGGGKSVLFQGAALLRNSFSRRLTIVITPLRALMEDQVRKLEGLGFFGAVECINQDTDNPRDVYRRLAGGEIAMLYITPERFRVRSFCQALQMRMDHDRRLEYAVFDEAHCISQWGHEFRPDYISSALLISGMKRTSVEPFPALCFSATLSEQVQRDLDELFPEQNTHPE